MSKPKVGVLALQGDFEAHEKSLTAAGAEAVAVRTAEELKAVDGLIIPGGESTTMLKLLHYMDLKQPLLDFAQSKPVFGTCAGAILLAREVLNPSQEGLNIMDLTVERNAYGRQIDSRIAKLEGNLEAVFIRAPKIKRHGPAVKVLAQYEGDPVLVEEGRHMVATFHPELTRDLRVHKLFLDKV